MIHWVTALRAEAEPLVESLQLRPWPGPSGFSLFAGDGGRLVISGIGRAAAAAGAAYLHAVTAGERAVWLNVGVAAHRSLPIGEALVAHKIVELATGRCWFPRLVVEPELPTATVCTVDRAVDQPEDGRVYEMEASGFFATTMRWATAEDIGCVKVISDHGVATGSSLSRRKVLEVLAHRVGEVVAFGRAIEALSAERIARTGAG